MLPKYLKIHGYRSYIDETIEFDKFGNLFCIVGENGAGKSSIIDMITTALYWKNPSVENSNTTMDDLINNNCEYFELEFCFSMSGHEYLIISKKKRGKGRELEFYIDGIDHSEKIQDTQKKIAETIKLDYNVFLDTICIGQGNSAHFMNKTPNERKETLAQILDLKKYELYEKEAKEQRKEVDAEIEQVIREIDFISSHLPDANDLINKIDNMEAQNEVLRKDLEDYQEKYDNELKAKQAYDALVEKNTFILNQRRSLENQMKELENSILYLDDTISKIVISNIDYEALILEEEKNIEHFKDMIHNIKTEIMKYDTENSFYKNEVSQLEKKYKQLDEYNESICEFCGNIITPEHKEHHLMQLKQSRFEIDKKIQDNKNKIDALKTQGNNISQLGKKSSQHKEELKRNLYKNEENKKDIQLKRQQCMSYKKQYHDISEQYKDNMNIVIIPLESKTFSVSDLKYKCQDCTRKIQSNTNAISVMRHDLSQAENGLKDLDRLNKQLNDLNQLRSDYDKVVIAFGKKGIQKSIIKNDLPLMEKNINDILAKLSDNTMSIEFITSKRGKTTDMDTFDIIVNDGNVSRSYDTYSGGERFRLDFACHVGLAKFLTGRVGASIDFFIIDEGLGSQDSSARQRFIEMLYKISEVFKQVLCITHISELQDSFESKILIEKDDLKGSKVLIL